MINKLIGRLVAALAVACAAFAVPPAGTAETTPQFIVTRTPVVTYQPVIHWRHHLATWETA